MGRLDRTLKHFGVYTNSKGQTTEAYLIWREDKKGWVVRAIENDKTLVTTSYPTTAEMKSAGIRFMLTGKTEEAQTTKTTEKTEEKETVTT